MIGCHSYKILGIRLEESAFAERKIPEQTIKPIKHEECLDIRICIKQPIARAGFKRGQRK